MTLTRRSVVVGFGTLLAGGGFVVASGAFSGNSADRMVTVEFADDSNAYLGMSPAKEDGEDAIVTEGDGGLLGVTIDNVNTNARTIFDDLIEFTNNSPRDVEEMRITVDDLSRQADLSVTDIPDGIPSGESVTGFGLVIDTRDYAGQPELNATINISTVLAAEEDS